MRIIVYQSLTRPACLEWLASHLVYCECLCTVFDAATTTGWQSSVCRACTVWLPTCHSFVHLHRHVTASRGISILQPSTTQTETATCVIHSSDSGIYTKNRAEIAPSTDAKTCFILVTNTMRTFDHLSCAILTTFEIKDMNRWLHTYTSKRFPNGGCYSHDRRVSQCIYAILTTVLYNYVYKLTTIVRIAYTSAKAILTTVKQFCSAI